MKIYIVRHGEAEHNVDPHDSKFALTLKEKSEKIRIGFAR